MLATIKSLAMASYSDLSQCVTCHTSQGGHAAMTEIMLNYE